GWGKAKTPSPLHSLSPNTTFSQQNDITLILLRKKQGFSNSLTFAGISSNSGLKSRNCCIHAAFHWFIQLPSFHRFARRHFSLCTVSIRAFSFFPHPHSLLTRYLDHFAMPMRHSLFFFSVHTPFIFRCYLEFVRYGSAEKKEGRDRQR
ncbi:hypothetical protein P4K96_00630, partial [Bacillus cereus]|nr:hypothetical protein [Bacillus cereus]